MANKRIRKKIAKRYNMYHGIQPTINKAGNKSLQISKAFTNNDELVNSAQRALSIIASYLNVSDNTAKLELNEKELVMLANGSYYSIIQAKLNKYKNADKLQKRHFKEIFERRLSGAKSMKEILNAINYLINTIKTYKPKKAKDPGNRWERYIQWVYYDDVDIFL